MRAIYNASIIFGLVNIPVKLYNTASAQKISFNWISPKGNKVKQKLFDAETNEEIAYNEVSHGYEVDKGQHVIFIDEDFKSLNEHGKSDAINICELTSGADLSPLTVEKSYYLMPDTLADKSYLLLARCLKKLKKVAICKWNVKGKDHLVALDIRDDVMVMHQMFFANELQTIDKVFAQTSMPSKKEMTLGLILLRSMVNENFSLSKYRNDYAGRVEAIARTKFTGADTPPGVFQTASLAALLSASGEKKTKNNKR